jgi:HEAT repeats
MRRIVSATKWIAILAGLPLVFALSAAAQQPRVTNAKLESRPAGANLSATVRALAATQESPAWVGYAVPMLAGDQEMCCGDWSDSSGRCGTCRLEREDRGVSVHSGDSDDSIVAANPVKLEGPRNLLVLFRLEHKSIDRVRAVSEDCELDGGGLPFLWLGAASPEQSVALLSGFVTSAKNDAHNDNDDAPDNASERRLPDNAITAIAFHNGAAADRALEGFIAPSQPRWLREKTSFWLGQARGHSGYLLLKRMAETDPSEDVRDKVAFALSQSHDPQAVDTMIQMARNDSSAHVRGQSLFWLGQKAGKKAVGAINDAIANDPDTAIKKKAVFALSQLPKDEGVPLLIQAAKNNKNPEVRKQAMFWLGQSEDPRALAFFEAVLAQ